MNKNIIDASKLLPDNGSREAFITLWKSINCMDLYDGDLTQYFQTIHTHIITNNRTIYNLQNTIDRIIEIIKGG